MRLSATAEADFENIIQWTSQTFGDAQAIVYAQTLSMALEVLTEGPTVIGARARDDIIKGLRTLHVARRDRHGRLWSAIISAGPLLAEPSLFTRAPTSTRGAIQRVLGWPEPNENHRADAVTSKTAGRIRGRVGNAWAQG